MKMRSPRSSFHHLVVTRPGRRRSSSRPKAIAAWRTSVKVQRGSNRPRMKRDSSHLGRPSDDGHLRGTDLIRVTSGGKLDPGGLHVVRSSTGDALLKEGVAAALLAR